MEKIDIKNVEVKIMIDIIKKVVKNPLLYMPPLSTFFVSQMANKKELYATFQISNLITYILCIYNIIDGNLTSLYTEICKEIRDTIEYDRTQNLYNEFLIQLVKFLKLLDINDSLDYILYIKKLIDSGIVSCNGVLEYNDNIFDSKTVPELMGARVVSGIGVCRHTSAFINDLLLRLNFCSTVLGVEIFTKDPRLYKYKIFKEFDHAVVGIIDSDGKYIYDYTNDFYGVSSFKYYNTDKYDERISYILNSIKDIFYYFEKTNIFNYQNEQNWDRFKKSKYKNLDLEEVKEKRARIEQIFKKNHDDHIYFYLDNQKLMEELAKRTFELNPYSYVDKPEQILTRKF